MTRTALLHSHKFVKPYFMGAGAELTSNNSGTNLVRYAPIVVETAMLKPTRTQVRALYTTFPDEGTAGQRPRTIKI